MKDGVRQGGPVFATWPGLNWLEDGAAASSRASDHHRWRLAGFAVAWVIALLALGLAASVKPGLGDAYTYWSAWHAPLYANGFVYPPLGALLFAPAAILPWPSFAVAWLTVLAAATVWLLAPVRTAIRIPCYIILISSMAWGNASTLLAVPLALAPRWPVLWVPLAWTKVTPLVAAVGLLRLRLWTKMAIAVAAVVVVGLMAFVFMPDWPGVWLTQLRAHLDIPRFLPSLVGTGGPSLIVRLLVATAISWVGASRPWTIAVAATIATPDLSIATIGLLAAIPRLHEYGSIKTAYSPSAFWARFGISAGSERR